MSRTKKTYGVTLELDITVKAESQEKAEKMAKTALGLATGCSGVVTGSWLINDSSTSSNIQEEDK